jgi:hypothetical protein
LLWKEQFVEIGAMQLDDDDRQEIGIAAVAIKQLLLEAKEMIEENALLDENYVAFCRHLTSRGKVDERYEIKDDLLCWNNRFDAPRRWRKRIMDS